MPVLQKKKNPSRPGFLHGAVMDRAAFMQPLLRCGPRQGVRHGRSFIFLRPVPLSPLQYLSGKAAIPVSCPFLPGVS